MAALAEKPEIIRGEEYYGCREYFFAPCVKFSVSVTGQPVVSTLLFGC
jgi:hypothetical protein